VKRLHGHLRLRAAPVDAMRVPLRRRWMIYLSFAVLVATGAVWLAVHWSRASDELPSRLEPISMKIHGAAAMFALFVFGTMFYAHMLRGWRAHHNRISGGLLSVACALLVLSGWGLYYLEADALRAFTDLAHSVIGVALPILLWIHIVRGRRLAARVRSHRQAQ